MEKTINGYNTEAIEATVTAINDNPKIAAFQFRVANEWISGSHNRSYIQDLYGACQEDTSRKVPFVLDSDKPPVLLGNNKAANPAEIMLHSLLGCMTTTMILQGSARGIKVTGVSSKVEGDIDLQGALCLDETCPRSSARSMSHLTSKATSRRKKSKS